MLLTFAILATLAGNVACLSIGYRFGKRYANRFYASKFARCEHCARVCITTNPQPFQSAQDAKSWIEKRFDAY